MLPSDETRPVVGCDAPTGQKRGEPAVPQRANPWERGADRVRVLVASGTRLIGDALAALLGNQRGLDVVDRTSPDQALSLAIALRPDIVLLDATRRGNLAYAKTLADQAPPSKVVAFGVAETDAEIVALAAAGVAGYVRDDAAAEDAVAVLRSAMRDELLCSPRVAATLCHHVALLSRNAQPAAVGDERQLAALSPRELQIADLLDRGLSNKEIARQLGIQAATVKNHVHNILDKLKVHRRGEAAACLRHILQERRLLPIRRVA